MLGKILRKTNVPNEYLGDLKITYINNVMVVTNYGELISINSVLVDLKGLVIKGEKLKVIYQDPVRIKIDGKISEVSKK
jgi:hypothetical protein